MEHPSRRFPRRSPSVQCRLPRSALAIHPMIPSNVGLPKLYNGFYLCTSYQGHQHPHFLLIPSRSHNMTVSNYISPEALTAIEQRLHDLIRSRARHLEIDFELPHLTHEMELNSQSWFPVPGMYGGFSYMFIKMGDDPLLQVESWCRVVGGSGQRHHITTDSTELVAVGFV